MPRQTNARNNLHFPGKEADAVREWEQEFSIYRITPVPPRENDLQNYIVRYLDEKDKKYFDWFLHYYERTVNEKVTAVMRDYAIAEHFSDIKQAYTMGMWAALQKYDPNRGIPFIVYKEYDAMREVYDYLRTAKAQLSIPSNDEYRLLRKIMRLYAEHENKYDEDTVRDIAGQTDTSEKTVREMIQAGLRLTQFVDYYREYADEEAEETREEVASDGSSETETLFFRLERANAVMDAFEHLDYRERAVVSAHLGFCMECYSTKNKGEPFIDIAIDHGLSSPDTADKIYRRALRKMKKDLEKQGLD